VNDCPMLRSFSLILQVIIICLPTEKRGHNASKTNINVVFFLRGDCGSAYELFNALHPWFGQAAQPSIRASNLRGTEHLVIPNRIFKESF
jgi:hypothetical protein